MRCARLYALLALGFTAGLFALSANGAPQQSEDKLLPPPTAGQLAILFSGELNGNLTPCGCSKPMVGGLPRRASFLKNQGAPESAIRLENGDLTEALGRQDELKAETIVETLNALSYDAINL